MTREQFIERAIRTAERAQALPRGWWGTWRDATNGRVRVKFARRCWHVTLVGALGTSTILSKHDSREGALRKALRRAVRKASRL